mmetsp:Transcript_51201/g.120160  ORF Transcript_51201/g.120160 Transcript_51201/m.120160 type:complete len:294 (+) Transcript_51201:807-1688(+)
MRCNSLTPLFASPNISSNVARRWHRHSWRAPWRWRHAGCRWALWRASEGPSLAKSFTASCDHTRPHNFSSGPAVGAACTVQPPVGTVSVQEGRLRHRRGRRRRTRLSREQQHVTQFCACITFVHRVNQAFGFLVLLGRGRGVVSRRKGPTPLGVSGQRLQGEQVTVVDVREGEVVGIEAKRVLKLSGDLVQRHHAECREETQGNRQSDAVGHDDDEHWGANGEDEQKSRNELSPRERERSVFDAFRVCVVHEPVSERDQGASEHGWWYIKATSVLSSKNLRVEPLVEGVNNLR